MTSRPAAPGDRAENAVRVLDLATTDEGHRGGYLAFISRLYSVQVVPFSWVAALTRRPVLIPMIEESFVRYVATALLRSMFGQRTVGLLFRPKPALEGKTLRLRGKRWALRLLRQLGPVRTLTILPFTVEPRFATIADDWIYDFEVWDLVGEGALGDRADGPLADKIRAAAAGRKVCCAIGRQDVDKGFDQFAAVYGASPALQAGMLFAFGGKVIPDLLGTSAEFAANGGFALPEYITNEQLLDLYASADLIWCVYAAGYDQASGVLGRAMQLGIPVVVRQGSLIHRLCELEGVGHLAFDQTTSPADFLRVAGHKDSMRAGKRAALHRSESLRRLSDALGVQPRQAS